MSKVIYPIVMDSQFNRIALIEGYQSLIWTTRYYDHGDFQLTTAVTAELLELLRIGNYIVRDDDENVGIIEKIDVRISETNEQVLTASGRFLTAILARRIIAEQTQVDSRVDTAVNKLITDAIISPDIPERAISNFKLGTYSIDDTIEAQYTGKNLYEVISAIALQYGIGFKIILDDNNDFVFSLYRGEDRSYNQSSNPYVIFSNVYDNLINAEYQRDATNYVTAVLAAGEGEGADRKTIWVQNSEEPTGLNRFEYYDDSRNISSNDGEISETDYYNQLAEAGRASLTTYLTKFAGEVNFSNLEYKQDVDIGDICVIEDTDLGVSINARIIEIIESIDESGKYSIIPTFGD